MLYGIGLARGPPASAGLDREHRRETMSMYQGYGSDSRPKVRIAVEIASDETTLSGHVFLNPNERIIDMMNDDRQYVAFESADGTFEVLSKVLLRRIRPIDQSRPDAAKAMPIMPGT